MNPMKSPFPRVLGIGTAVPENRFEQDRVKELAGDFFNGHLQNLARFLPVFDNTLIRTRYFVREVEWYLKSHTFAEKNDVFQKTAFELAVKASKKAISQAGMDPADIDGVVFVSSTGIATPSIDSYLMQELDISRNAARMPIWGIGCAGGVSGLARAAEMVQARNSVAVLLVSVEVCSISFQMEDKSLANLVGTSLFADGAAAVVVGRGEKGMEVKGSHSRLFDNTDYMMGWEILDSGLKVIFSKEIPSFVLNRVSGIMDEFCSSFGINRGQVKHFVTHPGGPRVLEAYEKGLEIEGDKLSSAYKVLADYGNMSSPSVLFVLEDFLENNEASGDYGAMMALGPGFSAEELLYKW